MIWPIGINVYRITLEGAETIKKLPTTFLTSKAISINAINY
jgi:hypothetical protein